MGTTQGVVRALWAHYGMEGRDRLMLAFAGPQTYDALHRQMHSGASQVAHWLREVESIPEGKVYIVTEGTLRNSLADWPVGDVLEIGGE